MPKEPCGCTHKQAAKLGFFRKNDNVPTPPELIDALNQEFQFVRDFDPCPLPENRPEGFDGLQVDWAKSTFINPPYSEIRKWLEKGILERDKGNLSVFLVPARVNSRYWENLVWKEASSVRFIGGTVAFPPYKTGLPVPLAIVVYDPQQKQKLYQTRNSGKYKFTYLGS